MCDEVVGTCPFLFNSIPDWYKTQKMFDKAFPEDPLMLKYCLDRHKTQEMCDKAVDDFLPTLKFVVDLFITSKMIKWSLWFIRRW